MEKKYKLKVWPKILLVILIVLGIVSFFGYQEYQKYLYRQTNEYALLELGYTEENTKMFLEKLSTSEQETIINLGYNEFLPFFVGTKYFMFKNINAYLEQVITQEEDFFSYHGTEGYDYEALVNLVNAHANLDHYTGNYKTDLSKEYAIIVNKYYELGMDYEPDDLVSIDWKYRLGGAKEYKYARKDVVNAYIEMWNAAYEQNIYLMVDSGYRSSTSQKEVYKYYENLYGTSYADSIAARPGYSEHQTGLSLDIYSKECTSAKTFKDSKTYAWLIENAYKYGFILRYPEGKKNITGYEYESWHYRYVGKELANKVKESGLTYDEYYAYFIE